MFSVDLQTSKIMKGKKSMQKVHKKAKKSQSQLSNPNLKGASKKRSKPFKREHLEKTLQLIDSKFIQNEVAVVKSDADKNKPKQTKKIIPQKDLDEAIQSLSNL